MFRKIIRVKKEEDLQVELPKEYLNKEIEVIAFQINDETNDLIEKSDLEEAMKFFDSIQIDMSNFKFNRDEANER